MGVDLQDILEKAIVIATVCHRGQIDKAGEPYILHPLRVMESVQTLEEKIVAVLHDVLGDCGVTREELIEAGIPRELVAKVGILTKRRGETYFSYIERVKIDDLARSVKLADLADNMDLSRLKVVTEKDATRQGRYIKAKRILEEGIKKTTNSYIC